MTPPSKEWAERFDEKFPHKIAEVVDDFGSTTKSNIRAFIEAERAAAYAEGFEAGRRLGEDIALGERNWCGD